MWKVQFLGRWLDKKSLPWYGFVRDVLSKSPVKMFRCSLLI